MKQDRTKKLLEELIEEAVLEVLLKEQTDFSNDVLYKAFVEPFADIVQTAQHGAEKIVATATGEAKLLAKQLAWLLVPFLNPDAGSLKNMTAQERNKIAQRLSGIDDKFKDVLDRNWQAFNNPDVWGTLFLMHPQLAIAQKLAVKAPEVALELLSVLTGGSEAVEAILKSYRQMRTGGGRVQYSQHQTGYGDAQGGSSWDDSYYGDYGGIYEQDQAGKKIDPESWLRKQVAALVNRPDVKKQIAASPITRAMQGEAINHIVRAATKDLGFDFAQLKTKLGANYDKAIQTIKAKLGDDSSDIESNAELQKKVVAEIKTLLKPAYIKQLQTLLQTNPNAKRLVDQAIQKVNAL